MRRLVLVWGRWCGGMGVAAVATPVCDGQRHLSPIPQLPCRCWASLCGDGCTLVFPTRRPSLPGQGLGLTLGPQEIG